MIKLNKIGEPDSLKKHKEEWTKEFLERIRKGEIIPEGVYNRYNQTDVKDTLCKETHNKCMYCESKISDISFPHIEHFRPKHKFPELTYEWSNLGLACQKCNMNKSETFDENLIFINPYIDNPDEHFLFLSTMIFHKDKRAEYTERVLQLNRPGLLESRKERMEAITCLIDKYNQEVNSSLRDCLENEIKKEIADDKPYASFARELVRQLTNIEI